MTRHVALEALAVGGAFALLYLVASYGGMHPLATAFVAGVAGHILFEAAGLNAAFCAML